MLGISNGGKKDATLVFMHAKHAIYNIVYMHLPKFKEENPSFQNKKQKILKFIYIPTMSKLHSTFFYSLFMQTAFYINYIVCLNCLKKYHKREDPVYV